MCGKTRGFQDFDDYLSIFNANQRRNIKRERKSIEKAGLRMEAITGDAITHRICDLMYDYYADTCDKFGWWGSKYLTRKFFQLLHHDYRHRMVFFAAYPEGEDDPIGMSFCLFKGERLYGRYWGSQLEMNNLHFNACYYAPIEWGYRPRYQLLRSRRGGTSQKTARLPRHPQPQPAPFLRTPTAEHPQQLY